MVLNELKLFSFQLVTVSCLVIKDASVVYRTWGVSCLSGDLFSQQHFGFINWSIYKSTY